MRRHASTSRVVHLWRTATINPTIRTALKYLIDQGGTFYPWSDLVGARRASTEWDLEGYYHRYPEMRHYAPKSVRLDAPSGGGRSDPEASTDGDKILLRPKFWAIPNQKLQDFVFTHEIGHVQIWNYGLAKLISTAEELGIDPWDTMNLPFGQFNSDEAFAECWASYHIDRDVQHKFPLWAKLVEAVKRAV